MRNITKRSIAITTAVAALAGAGVAFAAWTTNGSGSGSVTAASSKPLVITQTGPTVTGLFPTGSVNVPFSVKNDNPYAVALTGATGGTFTVDAAHSGCNVASLSADPVTLTGTTVAANSTGTAAAQTMTIKMSNAAVDACQGAIIGFTISVSGASA